MSKVNPHHILDSVTLRMLKTLIENKDRNYTWNKLAKASDDLTADSVYFRQDTFKELGIVKEAPVESPHDYWTFNEESRTAQILEELLYDIIEVDES